MTFPAHDRHPTASRRPPPKDPVHEPEAIYDDPQDIVDDEALTPQRKSAALDSWEKAVQMRLAATDEGMPSNGTSSRDLELVEEIEAARDAIKTGAVQLSTSDARQGTPQQTNYRVLRNSLMLLGVVAVAAAAAWWSMA